MKTSIGLLFFSLMLSTSMISQDYSYDSYEDHVKSLKKATLANIEMAYLDEGEGHPIMLIHGIPTNSWLYRKMVQPLVDKGFRVIVPDMVGCGESSTPKDTSQLSFQAQSGHLQALCNYLNLQNATLVVHDAGGPWSYHLLNTKSQPFDQVVLLNTILYTEGFKPPVCPKKGGLTHRMLTWAYGKNGISKAIIKQTVNQGLDRVKPTKEELSGYQEGFAAKGKYLASTFFGSLRDMDAISQVGRNALKEKNIPLLVLWGQNDKILVADKQVPVIMKDLNVRPEHAVLLAGCNHFVQEEVPGLIVERISDFVNSLK